MEGREKHVSAAHVDGLTLVSRENLDVGAHALENRRANEADFVAKEFGLKTIELTPVTVARDVDIDPAEGTLIGMVHGLGGEDRSRADAPDGLRAAVVTERVFHVEGLEELEHRGRLAARQDQAVHAREDLFVANLDEFGARGLDVRPVRRNRSLQGQHADPRFPFHSYSCSLI